MPKHNKRPTEFFSDVEDGGTSGRDQGTTLPTTPTERDRSPAVTLDSPTGPPRERYRTRARGDNAPLHSAIPVNIPPGPRDRMEGQMVQLADLLSIFSTSSANVKGKIDDTGRFEVTFELNQPLVVTDQKPERVSHDNSDTHSTRSGGASSGRRERGRVIGWRKPSCSPSKW